MRNREFAAKTARLLAADVQFRHVVANLVAQVKGDARAGALLSPRFLDPRWQTKLLSPGEYDGDLVKVNGNWLFARRVVVMDQPFGVEDL